MPQWYVTHWATLSCSPSLNPMRGVRISKEYNIRTLGSTQQTPGSTADPFTVLLTLISLFWNAHNGDMQTETYSSEKYHTFFWGYDEMGTGDTFPSSHVHIHICIMKTLGHAKQLQPATEEIKRGKLCPAGEHSLWSGEDEESERKACLSAPVCPQSAWLAIWIFHKGTQALTSLPGRDLGKICRMTKLLQEQPEGRNLLLRVKSS